MLSQGLEDAKHNLDELDSKLAEFKKQYVGQLPGDEENNLKILMELELAVGVEHADPEPGAAGQGVYRVDCWRSSWRRGNRSQSSTNPQTLEKQLSDLQSQLLSCRRAIPTTIRM